MPVVVKEPVFVKEVPGERPISPPAVPLTVVAPVLVIVEEAKTAKLAVLPGRIVGPAADVELVDQNNKKIGNANMATATWGRYIFFIVRFHFFNLREPG